MYGVRRALALCAALLGPADVLAAANEMIEIDYRDQDSDTAVYRSRILISPSFMRIDYGAIEDDFVLMDRKKQRIYNVTHEKKEVLEIGGGTVTLAKPKQWQLRHETQPVAAGKKTKRVKLYVNEVLCSEVTAQPGLLPDAVAALKQYRALLSQIQAGVFSAQPADEREYCDLAQHVFETSRELDFGFPLSETYRNGHTRQLEHYKSRQVDPTLFALPKTYRVTNLREIRGGV